MLETNNIEETEFVVSKKEKRKKFYILIFFIALIMIIFGLLFIINNTRTIFNDKKVYKQVLKEYNKEHNKNYHISYKLSEKELSNIKYLYLNDTKGITKGLNKLKNLECLIIKDSDIKHIDLSSLQNLKILNLENNKIKNIDVSHLSKLEELYLDNNKIKNINLKNNKNLKLLTLTENNLNSLNLTNNKLLEILRLRNSLKVNLRVGDKLKIQNIIKLPKNFKLEYTNGDDEHILNINKNVFAYSKGKTTLEYNLLEHKNGRSKKCKKVELKYNGKSTSFCYYSYISLDLNIDKKSIFSKNKNRNKSIKELLNKYKNFESISYTYDDITYELDIKKKNAIYYNKDGKQVYILNNYKYIPYSNVVIGKKTDMYSEFEYTRIYDLFQILSGDNKYNVEIFDNVSVYDLVITEKNKSSISKTMNENETLEEDANLKKVKIIVIKNKIVRIDIEDENYNNSIIINKINNLNNIENKQLKEETNDATNWYEKINGDYRNSKGDTINISYDRKEYISKAWSDLDNYDIMIDLELKSQNTYYSCVYDKKNINFASNNYFYCGYDFPEKEKFLLEDDSDDGVSYYERKFILTSDGIINEIDTIGNIIDIYRKVSN